MPDASNSSMRWRSREISSLCTTSSSIASCIEAGCPAGFRGPSDAVPAKSFARCAIFIPLISRRSSLISLMSDTFSCTDGAARGHELRAAAMVRARGAALYLHHAHVVVAMQLHIFVELALEGLHRFLQVLALHRKGAREQQPRAGSARRALLR